MTAENQSGEIGFHAELNEELLRLEVWTKLLDGARLFRYFSAMSRFYARTDRLVKFGLLIAATGALAPWLEVTELPKWVGPASASAVAVLAIVDLTLNLSEKALVSHQVSLTFARLDEDWHELWMDMQGATDPDVELLRKFRERQRELFAVGEKESAKLRPEFPLLNLLAAHQAYSAERRRYAAN